MGFSIVGMGQDGQDGQVSHRSGQGQAGSHSRGPCGQRQDARESGGQSSGQSGAARRSPLTSEARVGQGPVVVVVVVVVGRGTFSPCRARENKVPMKREEKKVRVATSQ